MKPFVARLYVILTIPLVLSACGVRDARYDPGRLVLRGAALPPDVLAPVSGVHATSRNDDPATMCCGMDASARFRVKKSIAHPRKLVVNLYCPDTSEKSLPMLQIRVGEHGAVSTYAIRNPGFNTVTIPLRNREASKLSGSSAVTVSMELIRPGGKVTKLNAAILTSVYFE